MVNVGSIVEVRKKLTKTHDLISTSYHEAGHTILGLLHFMKVNSVSVFENKKYKRIEGLCSVDFIKEISDIVDQDLLNYLIISDICVSYAGLTAERHFFKLISGSDKFPNYLKYGSSSDTLDAANSIKKYNLSPPGAKRYSFKRKLIKTTLNELKDNWDSVALISHALFEKKKLSYEDLKNILTKKSKNKVFWKKHFKILSYLFDNKSIDESEIKAILAI